jgi:hypothetical protein
MKLYLKYIVFMTTIFTFTAQATLISYNDEASFNAAITALNSTNLNFDNMNQGDTIASGDTVDGITFNYDLNGLELMVDNLFDTTSSENYLGVNDGDGQFFGGDIFNMTFASAQMAIGLYIHSADILLNNDIEILTSSGSTGLMASPKMPLTDGDAYFIGLVVDTTAEAFTSVNLSSLLEDYTFNVDDVTYASAPPEPPTEVPEPATILLMLVACTGLARTHQQKKQHHSTFTLEI